METISTNEKPLERGKYNQQYYLENKEILQQKYKSRVLCPLCDKDVAKASLNNHFKSQLCLKGQKIKKKVIEINSK